MNFYGNLSRKHSSWSILLMIYKFISFVVHEEKYMMLSMMISGPRQPANDIDVCLNSLIVYLKL